MPPHQYFYWDSISEGLPTKAKEDPSPHDLRLIPRWTSTQYFLVSGPNYYYYFCFYYYCYYHFYPPVLRFCIFYLSIFCLPFLLIFLLFSFSFFSYFALFSTLFNYLVLILGFNYCKFSLLFVFSINLCYLFPFSLTVFFTKCELFI